jgi:hypothetical protein
VSIIFLYQIKEKVSMMFNTLRFGAVVLPLNMRTPQGIENNRLMSQIRNRQTSLCHSPEAIFRNAAKAPPSAKIVWGNSFPTMLADKLSKVLIAPTVSDDVLNANLIRVGFNTIVVPDATLGDYTDYCGLRTMTVQQLLHQK